ncbi:MAG: PPOX class F420-dependent oxidoreductase [Acidimicrobiia bacterium]|nr:PPOX class F420-dependent oxidoreductase [bacterium]MDE0643516.1 PPOX class F420-dependent oxidoreductase [bacterium]MXZ07512.1 PPOX class F420-dependent oxidoreductase [Acidimicrobiia bacterium]MYH54741.1 PPOX class F420-dependent oxidoreductase [Acidimicrobiia bacterium]
MVIQQARDFIAANHRGVLLTFRADGAPQMSPILADVDQEGCVVVSSRETAYKVQNLERDPRASLCMFVDRFYGQWFQVDGVAEVVRLPEAMEPLVDYYRSVSGEHPDWEEYREAMRRERRVLIRISVQRAGPTRHG